MFCTKNKCKELENVCKNPNYCYIELPKEDKKILKYNHEEKFRKAPFAIYADMESLLQKVDTFHNNPEKSSTTKINNHKAFRYLLPTRCSFDITKNKHDCYRGKKDCMKNFCKKFKRASNKNNQL